MIVVKVRGLKSYLERQIMTRKKKEIIEKEKDEAFKVR